MDFAEEFVKKADQYNGFNLLIADIHSKSMVYITNRSGGDKTLVTEVSPGIHVLTNAALNSPWPKVRCFKTPRTTGLQSLASYSSFLFLLKPSNISSQLSLKSLQIIFSFIRLSV